METLPRLGPHVHYLNLARMLKVAPEVILEAAANGELDLYARSEHDRDVWISREQATPLLMVVYAPDPRIVKAVAETRAEAEAGGLPSSCYHYSGQVMFYPLRFLVSRYTFSPATLANHVSMKKDSARAARMLRDLGHTPLGIRTVDRRQGAAFAPPLDDPWYRDRVDRGPEREQWLREILARDGQVSVLRVSQEFSIAPKAAGALCRAAGAVSLGQRVINGRPETIYTVPGLQTPDKELHELATVHLSLGEVGAKAFAGEAQISPRQAASVLRKAGGVEIFQNKDERYFAFGDGK